MGIIRLLEHLGNIGTLGTEDLWNYRRLGTQYPGSIAIVLAHAILVLSVYLICPAEPYFSLYILHVYSVGVQCNFSFNLCSSLFCFQYLL